MYNYEEMLKFVEQTLIDNGGIRSSNSLFTFRNRFKHILRVYGWAQRLLEGVDNVNRDAVLIASIFHDVGYGAWHKGKHSDLGSSIFEEYAVSHQFPSDMISLVSDMIKNHSNKDLLGKNISIELTILMEADLLDEEGALGLVFDLLAEGTKNPDSYESAFNEIRMHSAHILDQDFMVTDLGKKFWEEKKVFIRTFINSLEYDLFME